MNIRRHPNLPARPKPSSVLPYVLAGLLAGLGTGCETVEHTSLTYKLWDSGTLSFNQPALNPDLAMYQVPAQHDILVEYYAMSDRHDQVRRQAYFLTASEPLIAQGKRPHFVDPRRFSDVQAIPKVVSTNEYFLANTNGQAFTLFRPGQIPERHNLPFYQDDHSTAGRVALTPFAVTGDVVMVGACAGVCGAVIVGVALCEGNVTIRQ